MVNLDPMNAVNDRIISDDAFRALSLNAKILFLWFAREDSMTHPDRRTRPAYMAEDAFDRALGELTPSLRKLSRYVTPRLPSPSPKGQARAEVIDLAEARKRLRQAA